MNKGIAVASIIFVLLIAYGAWQRYAYVQQGSPETNKIEVVTSFYPLFHIAEQIGGEYVHVVNLTPAGSEPHDFEPSPRDIAVLQDANIFIYNGAGFEPWVSRIVSELEQNDVRVVEATDGIELLAGNADEHEDEEEEHEDESFDPHVWLDPVLMKAEVNAIASAFVAADPAHAKQYMENARTYTKELEALHEEFVQGLTQCKRHDIVTSHAAFSYLASRYGLTMIPISGISPDEEPSPARMAEVANLVQSRNVSHIFFETLVSPKLAETIAAETGAEVASLNPLEGLTDEEIEQGKTYISVQRENLAALQTALGCI